MSSSEIALFQEFNWKEKTNQNKNKTETPNKKNKQGFMTEANYNSLSSQGFIFPFNKPAT